MDSSQDSTPVRNPVRLEGDGERNRNYSSLSVQLGQRNNVENLFTSTSNQSSSVVPLNRPSENHMNSLSGNEQEAQTSRSNEITPGPNRNSNNTPALQMCNNKVPKPSTEKADSAVAGSSRTIPNLSESNQDVQSCQRHKKCIDRAGSSNNSLPSTSGTSRACDNSVGSNFRENRKRPSSLKLNRIEDDSSSDTGNDDYSLGSEDGCIYTYRGGEHLADLPSSFFSLDMGLPLDRHLPLRNYAVPQQGAAAGRDQGSRASSPDMEFLEMDFDPGPSCEVDTGDESSPDVDLEVAGNMVEEIEPVQIRGTSPEYVPGVVPRYNPVSIPVAPSVASGSHGDNSDFYSYSVPSTSRGLVMGHGDASENSASYSFGPYITHMNTRGEQLLVRRTMTHGPLSVTINQHATSGNLVSPREMLDLEPDDPIQITLGSLLDSADLSSGVYHVTMAKKFIAETTKFEADAQVVAKASEASGSSSSSVGCVEPPRCMIWSECEACERQVTQIATSACGATAVVNVFNALGVPVNLERINSAVTTRKRANYAPLPRYLLSRAVAGCTAADLVSGIHRASDGLVTARFFPTYPERAFSLSHWLADWITLGAVPILTLNLQAGCEGDHVPDAWHHQMVFGVSPRGVYLCNPVECVREAVLWPQLTSPSVLLIRAQDILFRFTTTTDLTPLMVVPDRRFHTFNVLGQVVNVLHEWGSDGWATFEGHTRHVRIPAAYQAGITVAALTGSEAHRRLTAAPPLPLLAAAATASTSATATASTSATATASTSATANASTSAAANASTSATATASTSATATASTSATATPSTSAKHP